MKIIKYNKDQIVTIEINEGKINQHIKYHPEEIKCSKYLFGLFKKNYIIKEWYEDLNGIKDSMFRPKNITCKVNKKIESHDYFSDINHNIFESPYILIRFSNDYFHMLKFDCYEYGTYEKALEAARLKYNVLYKTYQLVSFVDHE